MEGKKEITTQTGKGGITPAISRADLLAGAKSFLAKQPSVTSIKKEITATTGLDVIFLTDTTGSMYPYFELVKDSLKKIISKVRTKQPNIRFGFIAYKNHGDEATYFDDQNAFFAAPLSANAEEIKRQIDKVPNGGGGDSLTALEDVFHHVNTKMGWQSQATKVVVLVGDMPPHGVVDPISNCPHEYDYRQEIQILVEKKVTVYTVFCFEEGELASQRKQKIQAFFKETAKKTGGKYLELAEIDDLVDLLSAICLKETGEVHLDEFIKELASKGQLTKSKHHLLLELKGEPKPPERRKT